MTDRTIHAGPHIVATRGPASDLKFYGGSFALLAADLALNRQTGLFMVPKGFRPRFGWWTITDIDTDASPAVVFSLGDDGSSGRFVATSTAGQAGQATPQFLFLPASTFVYGADTEITFTCNTAAATAAAGTLNFVLAGTEE